MGGTNGKPVSNYVLSPTNPDKYYGNIENGNITHIPYTSLSDVLSGNGIPVRLKAELINPEIPTQEVENFQLGHSYEAVSGNYTFFAPLNLKAGSSIVYRKTDSGWNDEDLDALTIEQMTVNLSISSDIPVSLHLTGYPIDANGNQINGVEIEGADIPAMADNQQLTLRITGKIKHLDGITFEARAKAEDEKTLTPQMNITLTNVRPRVTGYYLKKF